MIQARILLLAALVLVSAAVAGAPPGGDGYALSWFSLDCGGGTSAGGGLSIVSTIGQPDGAPASGGPFTMVGGFWAAAGPVTPPCAGDVNLDDVVDVADLVEVVLAWGTCPAPPSPCPADLTTDGQVDVSDLVAVILAWGPC